MLRQLLFRRPHRPQVLALLALALPESLGLLAAVRELLLQGEHACVALLEPRLALFVRALGVRHVALVHGEQLLHLGRLAREFGHLRAQRLRVAQLLPQHLHLGLVLRELLLLRVNPGLQLAHALEVRLQLAERRLELCELRLPRLQLRATCVQIALHALDCRVHRRGACCGVVRTAVGGCHPACVSSRRGALYVRCYRLGGLLLRCAHPRCGRVALVEHRTEPRVKRSTALLERMNHAGIVLDGEHERAEPLGKCRRGARALRIAVLGLGTRLLRMLLELRLGERQSLGSRNQLRERVAPLPVQLLHLGGVRRAHTCELGAVRVPQLCQSGKCVR